MKKRDRKRQIRKRKKKERRRARGKGRHTPALRGGSLAQLRRVRQYPIVGCWVQDGWEEDGLAVVTVMRQQPNGRLVLGNYLVDIYCLGVKDAFARLGLMPTETHEEYLSELYAAAGRPIRISSELAHEIIYGAIEYASQYGFKPHRDFAVAQYVLDPPEMPPQRGQVTFGHEGKPLYIAGPHDNARAIMAQLERTAGPGNYHHIIPLGGALPSFLDFDAVEEIGELLLSDDEEQGASADQE